MASIHHADPLCPVCGNFTYRFYKQKMMLGCQWCEMAMPLQNAIAVKNKSFRFLAKEGDRS